MMPLDFFHEWRYCIQAFVLLGLSTVLKGLWENFEYVTSLCFMKTVQFTVSTGNLRRI